MLKFSYSQFTWIIFAAALLLLKLDYVKFYKRLIFIFPGLQFLTIFIHIEEGVLCLEYFF